jgi:class 3 adenylate cyclase
LFAATEPNRVSALILVATWARMAVSEDMPWGTTVEQSAEQERLILEDFGTAFPRQIATGEVAAEQRFLAWLRRAIQRGSSPMRALALWRMSFEVDVRSVLSAISVPTLVMFGPRPRDLAEHGRYLAAEIDGAQQVELPKLGIWSFNDRSGVREEIEAFLTGARPAPMSDRVFATLMFTDVVSSTPRTVELGDRRWKQLLDRHDDVVRRDVERFCGNVVNTTGDGVLARFDGPARAVRCAQSVTSALRAHEIEIRAGLHAGEVETRGNDVTGIAVNIASRVSSLAEPGEILVSRTITDLVAGSGLEFEDRGDHELKGVPGRWQLYAVKS